MAAELELMHPEFVEKPPRALAERLYDIVWSAPTFGRQVALIDTIVEKVEAPARAALLNIVIERFDKIKSDRRDKFFYLFERSLGFLSFREILGLRCVPLLEHACSCIVKSRPDDWDDQLFLEFMVACPPWLCETFGDLRIPEKTVRPFLLRNLHPAKRQAMYRLFSG